MADHVSIPKSAYESLVRDVRRGIEVCGEMAKLRVMLRAIGSDDENVAHAIESCEGVARLRVELVALERRLTEADTDLTPVRPPSRTDIKAAFDASVDFAQGKRKPGG